jgi:putative chitinase
MTVTSPLLVAAKIKNPDKWLQPIIDTCVEFEITTPQRIAAFLAQTSHESGGYTMLTENLNYKAATLAACWPNRFAEMGSDKKPKKDAKGALIPTKVAQSIAGKPELIANMVYSSRMGNGAPQTGEGWKFRGRGLKQLTGKDNYERCGRDLGVDLVSNPDLLLEPVYAARSAGWFWKVNKLSEYADNGDIKGMTKKINGGYIGLQQRQDLYNKIMAVMNS